MPRLCGAYGEKVVISEGVCEKIAIIRFFLVATSLFYCFRSKCYLNSTLNDIKYKTLALTVAEVRKCTQNRGDKRSYD